MKFKIRHKLFFTLLLTSVIAASGLSFFLQWSFDRGFLNYVKNQEIEQLDRLASELTEFYEKHGSWDFLKENHSLWISTVGQADPFARRLHNKGTPLQYDRPAQSSSNSEHFNPSPPLPGNPRIFGQRVVLMDLQKNRIIGGPPEDIGDIPVTPIRYKEKSIGYLGLVPLKELSYSGDLLFVEQQKESFIVVTLFMVLFSMLLAYPLTSHLLRPINALTRGTNKLIAGIFKTRIAVSSGDELGRLSEHFNMLAMTLEKNEQARQQWVADISHELRTPLSVLRGEVEAIQDGVRLPDTKTILGLHSEIMHLERIVADLYELSMSDIGALNYKKTLIDPVGLLQTSLEMYEQRFASNNIEIQCKLKVEPNTTMLGDPDRIHQLFVNILENSLRYTDKPGILKIYITYEVEHIIITFQDSSPGVSDEQLPRLFDRLYRGDSSRNRSRGGAGLGLAICNNIVEAHEGSISANHSPLGGLQVIIDLPLHS